MSRTAKVTRNTKETNITVSLDMEREDEPKIATGVPFLDHMLTAFAFHGRFALTVEATGDTEVDPHHLVEDTGLVIGSCLKQVAEASGPIVRFGHSIIPMDEALGEATVDVCGRPTLFYDPQYPQDASGDFQMWLFRDFFLGLTMTAGLALHLDLRRGENSHHMIEALFKALGKAVSAAYTPADGASMSTKGMI